MELASSHMLCPPPPTGRSSSSNSRMVQWSKLISCAARQRPQCLAFTNTRPTMMMRVEPNEIEIENSKYDLLRAIQDTQRGLVTSAEQRASIEESLVKVETFDGGKALELNKLDGTWRLQYTSASDVLALFDAASRFPFFQVGQIFQQFECGQLGEGGGGYVRNVVRWSIPNLLEEQEGATLLVSAKFSIVSPRNIYLQFEEVSIQNINISEEFQAVIVPALLPRSFFSLQILQFIRTFKAQVPVRNTSTTRSGRQSLGGLYYLSYMDDNMLLGRALGGGGVFVFTKAHTLM